MWQINNDIFSPSPKTGHSSFSFPFLDIYYFWCTVYSLPCEDCSCGAQALECVGFSSWRISSLAVVCVLSCPLRMWDLSSPIRDQTHIPYIGRWLLNYWATKEVPRYSSSAEHLKKKKSTDLHVNIIIKFTFPKKYVFCNDTVVLFHMRVFKSLLHVWGSCVILELPKNKTIGNTHWPIMKFYTFLTGRQVSSHSYSIWVWRMQNNFHIFLIKT